MKNLLSEILLLEFRMRCFSKHHVQFVLRCLEEKEHQNLNEWITAYFDRFHI